MAENNQDQPPAVVLPLQDFDLILFQQQYTELEGNQSDRASVVKVIMRHWEVPSETFDSVLICDPISDDILRAAAAGTIVQWAPGCYTTQSRQSNSTRPNKKECNCVLKLLPPNSFEPLVTLCRGFVKAYKILERERILEFRKLLDSSTLAIRKQMLEKEKKERKDYDLPDLSMSKNAESEEKLLELGPTSYNHFVKRHNLSISQKRTENDQSGALMTPYQSCI